MSTLSIGPSLYKIFGVDLILLDDCVDFVMEKCYRVECREVGAEEKEGYGDGEGEVEDGEVIGKEWFI